MRGGDHSPERGGGIGELMRLAEVPDISAENAARHKALARAYWQRKVRARAMRRRLGFGLAAAAILGVAIGLWSVGQRPDAGSPRLATASSSQRSGPVARLAAVVGPVRADTTGDGAATAIDAGGMVDAGTVLETGIDSRAAFQLAGGHELRLDVDTRLRLVSERRLALERGAVYVDSRAARGSIEIRTALGTARDVGTRFEVRLGGGSLRVRVRDGLVEVARGDVRHQAGAGAELTLDAAGGLERSTVPIYGPEWRWSLEVAPVFDLEGRNLREFLAWVTHETGWLLRVDPVIAAGAATVTVSGDIDGLTPDEALDVVLPITGLRHRVVDGELIVEPIT